MPPPSSISSRKRLISSAAELDRAIEDLERKAAYQKEELKEHFAAVMDNLKPFNIIKHGLQSTFAPGNRQDLLKAAIGIGSGILGRKLMVGNSGKRVVNKLLGAALEFGLLGYVLKHAGSLKEKGSAFLTKIFHRKGSTGPEGTQGPENQSL